MKPYRLPGSLRITLNLPSCRWLNPPYLYRSGRVPGTCELVAHPNYVLVYRVAAECIEVVSVLHSRQEYP